MVLHCTGAHSKAPIQHVFSPRKDWVALVWDIYAMCMAPDWQRSLCYSLSASSIGTRAQCCQALSYRGKREPCGLFPHTLCLGQFGVRVLQVAAEDLSGCGEALIVKAQHYCSVKRNVIGTWD